MSNLIRLKVGCADYRAHPDRTSSASQGARMLLLLPQAFLCVLCVQYVKELLPCGLVSGRESNPDYTREGNVQPPFRSFTGL